MIGKSQLNQSALAALGPAEKVASQAAATTGRVRHSAHS